MKRVELYKDITTGNVYTLQEMKEAYVVANNCELPIDDYTMKSIIFENLTCVGGNIEVVNDYILDFLNDFADFMDAERGMRQEEINASIKENYIGVFENDSDIITSILDNIEEYNEELTKRFEAILQEV